MSEKLNLNRHSETCRSGRCGAVAEYSAQENPQASDLTGSSLCVAHQLVAEAAVSPAWSGRLCGSQVRLGRGSGRPPLLFR